MNSAYKIFAIKAHIIIEHLIRVMHVLKNECNTRSLYLYVSSYLPVIVLFH